MKIWASCEQCAHRHPIDFDPLQPEHYWRHLTDWNAKHLGHHGVGFTWPERTARPRFVDELRQAWDFSRGVEPDAVVSDPRIRPDDTATAPEIPHAIAAFLPNANVNVAYGASAAPTLTLASLAASSGLLAGRESTAVDNGASTKYLDIYTAGNYRAAASNNQAGTIYTCVVGARDDTPTWPDVFDGTDSTETVTDQGTFDSICRIISSIAGDNTASQTWYWGPVGIAGFFGGVIPDQFVYFISQSIQTSTNAWSATEGDHSVKYTGITLTVV